MRLGQLFDAAREELDSREDEIVRRIVQNTIRQMVAKATRELMYDLTNSIEHDVDVTLISNGHRRRID
jgi:hypothetical protein